MSDYPSASQYGANYGSQNQPNPPYLPPTYPNQYSRPDDGRMGQNHYAPNYDANMSAYGYNGHAPGFTAAPIATGAPPLPMYQGWNQDPVPVAPYNEQHDAMQRTGYTSNAYNNYSQHYPTVQHSYQQSMQPAKPYDEGEVSEGEFDGGYPPQNPVSTDYTATQYGGNVGNGFVGTAHRAVYHRSQNQPPVQTSPAGNEYSYPREVPQTGHQQPSSFSPYAVSSSVGHWNGQSGTHKHYNGVSSSYAPDKYINGSAQDQNKASWDQNRSVIPSRSTSLVNGNRTTHADDGPAARKLSSAKASPARNSPSRAPVAQYSTQNSNIAAGSAEPGQVPSAPVSQAPQTVYDKLELRKKAEGAILNLLPHDIRFEKYMEEGIAEDVVGSLFDDLRIPRTPSKPAIEVSLLQNASGDQRSAAASSRIPNQKDNLPFLASGKNVSVQAQTRDHIAAKKPLDAHLSKNATMASPSSEVTASPTTTAITNPPITAAATEKEQTLKKKMEALRKSREERAQKAAAKNNAKPATSGPVPAIPKPDIPASAPAKKSSNPPSPTSLTNSQQSQIQIPTSQPPSQDIPAQQIPAIPGLFLASAAASPVPVTANAPMYNFQVNPRKRPVAADFVSPAKVGTFKRPFGQSRSDTNLVIDVSEDEGDSEDGDVAMDLDSQADQDSPVQSASNMSDQRNTALQNLPLLTNFPSRKPYTPPQTSSAATTPPAFIPTRKANLGKPEDLQAKEMQIEELRRKIAEAEAAKAQKKAQQSANGNHTPQPVSTNNDNSSIINGSIAKKVETSIQIQNMIGIAEEKVYHDQKRLVEARAIEEQKATELKEQEAESKRLRREKIATDLPRVDAEVLEKQRKLEQLKAQMAEIEAEVQKNLKEKEIMAEEMERLGHEAEEQLQAQKEKLRDLREAETEGTLITPRHASSPPVDTSAAIQSTDEPQLRSISGSRAEPTNESEALQTDFTPSMPIHDNTPITNLNDGLAETLPSSAHPEVDSNGGKSNITVDQDMEDEPEEAFGADADSRESHRDTDEVDVEDSYVPPDADQSVSKSPSSLGEDVNRSPSYSPVLERIVPIIPDAHSDADYEPPDATPPVDSSPSHSPPFSPAPAEPVREDANDLVIFPSSSGPVATDDIVTVDDSLSQTNGSILKPIEDVPRDTIDQTQYFTPYQSPLKQFRAYRYHPLFNQEVPGGFRSLTYSHRINPNTEMCPWELAGGACNDNTCQFQHFKNIVLPDDAVLTALGSPDEFTGEQRKKFCEGLKEVLTGLRARKIRDFDLIAQEVVAHRARFLGDNSKVLMLEGISI